ncbi:hypothetical protein BLS_009405 [Venturia inaequalis]|uniref:Retrovirus-related Pol polyprotein from transposon TNT 1-94-like beta-barrel domain-containing protein n=1 Tax=Venturia inaequalis TaxID=5025 RepID=A0A8H3V2H3_VENIN|nr:hypothetical protein BLS_009405 [Venturia inaequalis]
MDSWLPKPDHYYNDESMEAQPNDNDEPVEAPPNDDEEGSVGSAPMDISDNEEDEDMDAPSAASAPATLAPAAPASSALAPAAPTPAAPASAALALARLAPALAALTLAARPVAAAAEDDDDDDDDEFGSDESMNGKLLPNITRMKKNHAPPVPTPAGSAARTAMWPGGARPPSAGFVESGATSPEIVVVVLCPDWVWSTGSNMNIAKDRAWFRHYTPLREESFVTDTLNGSCRLPVIGFGTVEITTQCPPGSDYAKTTILLENVLHVPSSRCNIMGAPFTHNYMVGTSKGNRSLIFIKPISSPHKDLSDTVGYFDADQFAYRLMVEKAPLAHFLGPYVMHTDTPIWISVHFPEEEWWKRRTWIFRAVN